MTRWLLDIFVYRRRFPDLDADVLGARDGHQLGPLLDGLSFDDAGLRDDAVKFGDRLKSVRQRLKLAKRARNHRVVQTRRAHQRDRIGTVDAQDIVIEVTPLWNGRRVASRVTRSKPNLRKIYKPPLQRVIDFN